MTKILYIAPFGFEVLNKKFDLNIHVAAASNKIKGICYSLSSHGFEVFLISSPIITRYKKLYFEGISFNESDINVITLPAISLKYLNRCYASIQYFLASFKYIESTDRVIFYNFFIEYLPAIIALRIRKIDVTIDIEDAPIYSQRTFRDFVAIISFSIIKIISPKKYFVASHSLAKYLNLENYLCLYGIRQFHGNRISYNNPRLRILYGGALLIDTGIDIFCDTLKKIYYSDKRRNFCFVISGFGDLSKIKKLSDEICDDKFIELHLNVEFSSYVRVLKSCHVGLCLKIANSSIGSTTFPSKVIEISSNGLLLVTTDVSDIPLIFSDENSVIIKELDSSILTLKLFEVEKNREKFSKIAAAGAELMQEKMSKESIGLSIINFLDIHLRK